MSQSVPSRRASTCYDLVWDVATKEMNLVGQDPDGALPEVALHLEAVRRIQVETFRWLATQSTEAGNGAFREMFEDFALRVDCIPEYELWTGRPSS